jgi:hypothetical protein
MRGLVTPYIYKIFQRLYAHRYVWVRPRLDSHAVAGLIYSSIADCELLTRRGNTAGFLLPIFPRVQAARSCRRPFVIGE